MSAFDPFYSEVKEGILKPSEELENMKVPNIEGEMKTIFGPLITIPFESQPEK